jgi:Leucine-rich repeat (LRR) protein
MAAPFFKNHAQLESAVCARDLLVFNHRVLCAKNESVRIDTFLGKSHQITEIDKLFFDINITAIDSIAELCAIVELMQLQGRDPHPELVTALDFSNCHLTHLPEAMNQYWKEIAGLDLSNNQLQELPKGIGQCQKLLQLSISDNPLQSLPKELFQIESLISVSADADQRSQFPELSFLKQFRNGKRDVM